MARSKGKSSNRRRVDNAPPSPKKTELKTFQMTHEAIERHWESFPKQAKTFLLDTLDKMSLYKLIRFWSDHQFIEFTRGKVAGSICGASWYLALVYLKLGKVREARALTLNGSFLQQCYNTSIEYIQNLCQHESSQISEDKLPFFCTGFFSVPSPETMDRFLQSKLPAEYQRMMTSFVGLSTREPTMEYIDQISNDWNSSSQKNQRKRRPGRESEGDKIEIAITDEGTNENHSFSIGVSTTLKTLFNEYADEMGISLRSLRFSYKGKTIFLSSVGHKTPKELGMHDHDVIIASSTLASQVADTRKEGEASKKSQPSKRTSPKKKTKGKGKKKKGNSTLEISKSEEDYKVDHSNVLTRLFEEASPKFKQIRQDLNALILDCQKPKEKVHTSKPNGSSELFVCNPPTEGLGGKAGKSHFIVQVGEVENLYKTTKPSSSANGNGLQPSRGATLDLHGCTKEEALTKLDESLKEWKDVAMKGSYPWVIPAVIVCGCGNQILSETVEQWIKKTSSVANAPKSLVSQLRHFMPAVA